MSFENMKQIKNYLRQQGLTLKFCMHRLDRKNRTRCPVRLVAKGHRRKEKDPRKAKINITDWLLKKLYQDETKVSLR